MKYVLYYGNFEYEVEQSYNDILEFEFSKTFTDNPFIPFPSLCSKEQAEFIKNFENKWLRNEIHEYDYYTTRNYEFLDWLKDKYEDAAESAQYVDEEEYDDPDEWWGELDYTAKMDVMEAYNGY